MNNQQKQKLKELELPKIGIAGVLFFVIQFLYGHIETDNQEFQKDLSELLVSTASINQRVIGVESQLTLLTEKTGSNIDDIENDLERVSRELAILKSKVEDIKR